MNPFNPDIFAVSAPCMPCCGGEPTECACALLIPPFASPYADYATAAAAIAGQTNNCLGYINSSTFISFTAVDSGTSLDLEFTAAAIASGGLYGSGRAMYGSVSLAPGDTLSVDVTMAVTAGSVAGASSDVYIFDCAGNFLYTETVFGAGPNTVNFVVPDSGAFTVFIISSIFGLASPFNFTVSASIYSSGLFLANPIIALWDDSGTTRQLYACPGLDVTLLGPGSGYWYPSLATAQSEIAKLAYSCLAVSIGRDYPGSYSFSATDGGTDVTLSGGRDNYCDPLAALPTIYGYISVSLEAGDILSAAWSASTTGDVGPDLLLVDLEMWRLDESGIWVSFDSDSDTSASSSDSGTLTCSAVSIPGNYRVLFIARGATKASTAVSSVTAMAVISSSGSFQANPIYALYDIGLDCPAIWWCDGTEESNGSWTPGGGSCGVPV